MAKRKSSGGRESSSQASASNLQPSPTPKDEQSAKRRMSERLRRLQAAGAVNGLLQNGGGGLAIIGAPEGASNSAPPVPGRPMDPAGAEGRPVETDREVIETRDDAEMMRRPQLWPSKPILSIKRYKDGQGHEAQEPSGLPELGTILEGHGSKVFLGSMACVEVALVEQRLDDIGYTEYPSYEAIVADGWVVD